MLRAKIMKVFAVSLLVSALVVLLLQADFWMGALVFAGCLVIDG